MTENNDVPVGVIWKSNSGSGRSRNIVIEKVTWTIKLAGPKFLSDPCLSYLRVSCMKRCSNPSSVLQKIAPESSEASNSLMIN